MLCDEVMPSFEEEGGQAEPDFYALLAKRARSVLPAGFLARQTGLDSRELGLVLDWALGVCEDLGRGEVFPLAAHLLARVLGSRDVAWNKLQLSAAACLSISSKIAGCGSPGLSMFAVDYTLGAFTQREAGAEEWAVLKAVGYNAILPTPLDFLGRYEHLLSPMTFGAARYTCTLSAFAPHCYSVRADAVASSCVWLAAVKLRKPWTQACQAMVPDGHDVASLHEVLRTTALAARMFPKLRRKFREEHDAMWLADESAAIAKAADRLAAQAPRGKMPTASEVMSAAQAPKRRRPEPSPASASTETTR